MESTEQVKNPWHSEEFLPGFENIKPPPSFWRKLQIRAALLRENKTAAVSAKVKESPLGLTQAPDFRCGAQYLYRGEIPGILQNAHTLLEIKYRRKSHQVFPL